MKINPFNVGKAFLYFIIGTLAIYILYGIGDGGIINICLDVFSGMLLIPADEWVVVAPIIWWGTLFFSLMAVIIYPIWSYFEEEDAQ